MSERGYEHTLVELPLIGQLEGMNWRHVRGGEADPDSLANPADSLRGSFGEAILESILRRQLRTLNLDANGDEWLDEHRVSQVVGQMLRPGASSLLEANTKTTELLLKGTTVDGLPGWDGGRPQHIQYIDWQHPKRNDFLAISQFRVTVPGAADTKPIIPDLVLFVNGIPLVVIECKKPTHHQGSLLQAITQLRRYANQRNTEMPEGNERLFHTVQLTVATTGDKARLGTYTARPDHYAVWRHPYPLTKPEIAAGLGKPEQAVTEQDVLAAVILHPERLLDIVQNFVVFKEVTDSDGASRRVKIAPRWQQYRAVSKAVHRLRTAKTLAEDGREDRRGGIIWHTQGSGKSLEQVFLVRKLRSTPELEHFKVVVVTDRRQLQKQLSETAELTGEKPDVVKRARSVPPALSRKGAGLVFVMIQKQVDVSKAQPDADTIAHDRTPGWGHLNDDNSILILVDEAHRSHGSKLHQNLMDSLPNAARIGFTGTPIIMGAKKKTTHIFGDFIDCYRLREAEEDGAIVPILYEGRIAEGALTDRDELEDELAEYFPELTEEEYQELSDRYLTTSEVLAADDLIRKKARDMLNHYVVNVMRNGFKAQVVAYSRVIAVRYRQALSDARDKLVAEAKQIRPNLLEKQEEELTGKQAILVAAYRQLDLLQAIDFVPVISEGPNDPADHAQWTDSHAQDKQVDEFLRPFPTVLAEGDRPVAFLIVRTMLLTGFDAPIEQVMYLDRRIKEAELLQAIARVNRTAEGKQHGLVVDYAGISKQLQHAMAAYAAEEAEGAPKDFDEEIAKLAPRRDRLRMIFTERSATPADSPEAVEACVQILEDDERRARFDVALRQFLSTVGTVMPRRQAKPFLGDARLYALIGTWARARYEGSTEFDASLYGEKVRELIDRHVTALGVRQVIPPNRITAEDFKAKVEALPGARAQASTMEHAIRRHIEVYFNQDPAAYGRLRERLEKVLRDYAERWEQQVLFFEQIVDEAVSIQQGGTEFVDPKLAQLTPLERALYGLLVENVATDGMLPPDRVDAVYTLVGTINATAYRHTRKKDFWSAPVNQRDLRTEILRLLIDERVTAVDEARALADDLLEIVSHHRHAIR